MIKIAAITTGEMQNGDHVLIVPKKDIQEMINVFTIFCEDHPRKKNAKKLRDQLEPLEVW